MSLIVMSLLESARRKFFMYIMSIRRASCLKSRIQHVFQTFLLSGGRNESNSQLARMKKNLSLLESAKENENFC